ncbi:queuine tRNA-ribosyltransferase accessory subunit 2 isoform X3 [Dermochelys coriacea]|uniref:queuine tRNA-ribosyltransferase accessory subunit 2 isoform X3 n=1 Tax=Dermochelys coriacea TaxID=27794 RepID=UPI001CA7ED30|nr:queuine tRNA-ribosyltransferase accessory subunit 2 isoform X3 [Dermochelys coriacea]
MTYRMLIGPGKRDAYVTEAAGASQDVDTACHLTRMKLSLSKVVSGCRLGTLTNLGKNGVQTMELPGCLLYTKTGSPPHLTHDTLQAIKGVPAIVQLTLSTLVELHEVLEEYKEGIGKFIGLRLVMSPSLDDVKCQMSPEHSFSGQVCQSQCCTALSMTLVAPAHLATTTTRGHLGTGLNPTKLISHRLQCCQMATTFCRYLLKTVSLWGYGGRMEMTASKFMSMQRALQPDWFQCLSDGDTISGETSRKRAKKSVDRSLSFLDECLQLQEKSPELQDSVMVGVIEGGDMLEERLRSARETAKRPVGGFLLDGFQGQAMAKETKLKLLASVTAELPEDKPRLIHGIGKPDEVLECIERGVDVFESVFPYHVTERGCALSFSYDYSPDPEAAVIKQNGIQDAGKNGAEKDINETSKADPEITPFEIFLKEKRYRDDFRPLVHGCTCYCCQNHSRAYVHHLLVTNELLAGVLLMMHNFQHYFSFFHSIRDALRDDRLDQLKELIFRQAL